jgi:hypothetical protein
LLSLAVEKQEARSGFTSNGFSRSAKTWLYIFAGLGLCFYCVTLENCARLELIYEGRFFEGDARFGARSYAARFFLIERLG